MSGSTRFWLASIAGLIAGVITWVLSGRWPLGLLILVLVSATLYVVWSLVVLTPMDPEQTRMHAVDADVNQGLGDLALLFVLSAGLAAIGILLMSGSDRDKTTYAALAIAAVLAVWAMLHTMHAARYARLYYQGAEGGIDFNSDVPPRYMDFCYFSFNLGMTYQVSDTPVTDSAIRSDVLKHCLSSYIYGTILIACTINLVLGLVS